MGKINLKNPVAYRTPEGNTRVQFRNGKEICFNHDGWEIDDNGNVIKDAEYLAHQMDKDQIIDALKSHITPIQFNPKDKIEELRRLLIDVSEGKEQPKPAPPPDDSQALKDENKELKQRLADLEARLDGMPGPQPTEAIPLGDEEKPAEDPLHELTRPQIMKMLTDMDVKYKMNDTKEELLVILKEEIAFRKEP